MSANTATSSVQDEAKFLVKEYFTQIRQGCGDLECTNVGFCLTADTTAGKRADNISVNAMALKAIDIVKASGRGHLCSVIKRSRNDSPSKDQGNTSTSLATPVPQDSAKDMTDSERNERGTIDAADNNQESVDTMAHSMVVEDDTPTNAGLHGVAHQPENAFVGATSVIHQTAAGEEAAGAGAGAGAGAAKKKGNDASAKKRDVDDREVDAQPGKKRSAPKLDVALSKFELDSFDAWFDGLLDQCQSNEAPPEVVEEIQQHFGSAGMSRLMDDFMKVTLDDLAQPPVDLKRLRHVFKRLDQHEAIKTKLIESCLDLLSSLQKSQSQMTSDLKLRIFIVLLELPYLQEADAHDKYFPRLGVCIVALSDEQRKALSAWIEHEAEVSHLEWKVNAVSQYMTLRAMSQQIDDERYIINHDRNMRSAVILMDILYRANDSRAAKSKDSLSTELFQNDGVNEYFCEVLPQGREYRRLQPDYELWKPKRLSELNFEVNTSPQGAFTFCDYSFTLSAPTKVKMLSFENKLVSTGQQRAHERQRIFALLMGSPDIRFTVNIHRDNIVRDALREISRHVNRDPEVVVQPLLVNFIGEEGLDYGGVKKEFFQLMIKELFDPKYGMFEPHEDTRVYWFRRSTFDTPAEFNLLGLIVGLALYNNVILDLHFPQVLYRKLLKEKVTLFDLKGLDPMLARSLQQLLDYDGEDVEDVFCMNFSVLYEEYGAKQVDELCENGANLPVTRANKEKYVKLYVDYILSKSIEKSFTAFFDGFWSVCGQSDMLKLFGPQELEQVVCGMQDFDFEALESVCKYDGFDDGADTEVVKWFWEIARNFPNEEKKQLLAFATGSDRVPIGGLHRFKFVIAKQGANSDQLPTSHTCFNVLMLPEYDSKEKLDRLLRLAIANSEGFGMI